MAFMIGGERMNGFYLVIPLLIIRFGLLSVLNKQAVQRAGYYAPVQAGEVLPSYIYQVSNVVLFLYLFGTKIEADFSLYFYGGVICYCIGILLCIIATMNFAFPNAEGLNTNGVFSNFSSLDYSFGRTMVYRKIWGFLQRIYGKSSSLSLEESFLTYAIIILTREGFHDWRRRG